MANRIPLVSVFGKVGRYILPILFFSGATKVRKWNHLSIESFIVASSFCRRKHANQQFLYRQNVEHHITSHVIVQNIFVDVHGKKNINECYSNAECEIFMTSYIIIFHVNISIFNINISMKGFWIFCRSIRSMYFEYF